MREAGARTLPPADAVVARLLTEPRADGPTILVEPADNIGGGAPGDGTGVLRALLAHGASDALVVINDPVAVHQLHPLRPGDRRTLSVGGRGSRLDPGPVPLDLELVSRSDGEFELEDPRSHLASLSGTRFSMGRCVVARAAGITLLFTSRKTPPFDLGQLRSQGLDPRAFRFIVVKAAVAHRRAYDPIAAASHWVATPGPCSDRLETFPWQRLRRPVWPVDAEEDLNVSK